MDPAIGPVSGEPERDAEAAGFQGSGPEPAAGLEPPAFGAPAGFGTPSGYGTPPGYGQAPYGQQAFPGGPAGPTGPAGPNRRRTAVIWTIAGLAAVAVVVAVVAVVAVFAVSHVGATANMRVITPAPAKAAGLTRDYATESNPRFQAALSLFRSRYASILHHQISSYADAIYSSMSGGAPSTGAPMALLYMGFNSSSLTLDTQGAISSAMAGVAKTIPSPRFVPVTGLPGDMKAECVTSSYGTSALRACGWASDQTLAVFVALGPNTSVSQLANLMKELRPDLVRG